MRIEIVSREQGVESSYPPNFHERDFRDFPEISRFECLNIRVVVYNEIELSILQDCLRNAEQRAGFPYNQNHTQDSYDIYRGNRSNRASFESEYMLTPVQSSTANAVEGVRREIEEQRRILFEMQRQREIERISHLSATISIPSIEIKVTDEQKELIMNGQNEFLKSQAPKPENPTAPINPIEDIEL